MKKLDLINKKFNRLTVLEKVGHQGKKVLWKCQCDCGKITYAVTYQLTTNKVKSCGCLKLEKLIQRSTKHNQRHTKLYNIWRGLRNRCYNPNNPSYKNYGGRGIKVCDEWKNDYLPFYQWSMQNGYKDKLSIDRIDNNGNYEPSNCRWADRKTQANNTRANHYITFNGETKTLTQWAETLGIKQATIRTRLDKYHWSIEKALTTPPKH